MHSIFSVIALLKKFDINIKIKESHIKWSFKKKVFQLIVQYGTIKLIFDTEL